MSTQTFDQFNSQDRALTIGKQLSDLQDQMKAFQAETALFDTLKSTINEDIKTQLETLNALKNKARDIETLERDIRIKMRGIKSEEEKLGKELLQVEANKAMADEYALLSEQFDRLTASAKWREFAMPHQMSGAKHMASSRRCINADKMGLGKSLQAIMAVDMLQARKVLIVTPNDVVRNFHEEVQHWTKDKATFILANLPKNQRDMIVSLVAPAMDEFVMLINYEAWRKDKELITGLQELQFDTIILDEAHVLKNRKTSNFHGVKDLIYAVNKCPLCGSKPVHNYPHEHGFKITRCSDLSCDGGLNDEGYPINDNVFCSVLNVFPMTGTPILNKPQDMFALLHLLNRSIFSSEYDFLDIYCTQDVYTGRWKFTSGGLDSLIKRLSSMFVMRDRKASGVVLPPQKEMLYYLDYSDHPEQAKINKELSKYAAIVLDSDDTKAISIPYLIALITRKRQAAVWPEGIEFKNPDGEIVYKVSSMQSVKMDKCIVSTPDGYDGLIPEIAGSGERYPVETGRTYGEFEGERVVVFSQFKTALAELETRLVSAGYSVLRLDGDSNDADRNAARTDFDRKLRANADYQGPRYQIILANYKTGGVGLNFTDATHLIELDSEWSPGKVDQARGRIDRIGQTEETTVHRLLVSNSIETWLDNLVQTKRELVQGFEEAANLMQSMMEALRNEEI